MSPRLALHSQSSCLNLPGAETHPACEFLIGLMVAYTFLYVSKLTNFIFRHHIHYLKKSKSLKKGTENFFSIKQVLRGTKTKGQYEILYRS
jgi:hypothetical protein